MGSGCNENKFTDGCVSLTSDRCVVYTGPDIPILGICNGDRLSEIEDVILSKLQSYANGEGVILSNVTANCDFVKNSLVDKDKDLASLIQVLFDQNCSLYSLFKSLENKKENPYPFDIKCLAAPSSPSRDEVIQSLINKVCELNETVEKLLNPDEEDEDTGNSLKDTVEDIVGNFMRSNISSCSKSIEYSGWGKDTSLLFKFDCPPGTLLFGMYDPSWFDSQGRGSKNAGLCGWVIADGRNGSTDMRGLTASGATNISGGGALLPSVTISGDSDTQTSVGSVKGVVKNSLTINNIPDHEHNVSDPGHQHPYENWPIIATVGSGSGTASRNNVNTSKVTGKGLTGISVKGMKNKTANTLVDNRQPTRYGIWIQRVGSYLVVNPDVPPPDKVITVPWDGGLS